MEDGPGLSSKEVYPAIFSRHAEAYRRRLDGIMARGEARGRRRVIDLLELRPGMRVLDLACGPGTLSGEIAARVAPGGAVVGVDLAAGMVELARSLRMPNARFELMDAERLTFDDATFDAAACGHGLQFLPDLPRALRETRRVLRAGARFAASVPAGGGGGDASEILDRVIERRLPPARRPDDHRATQTTLGDPDAFRDAALESGFATARVEVILEAVRWESAEELVELSMGWWDLAARLDGVPAAEQAAFRDEAVASLKRRHPGAIETSGRTHVLLAVA